MMIIMILLAAITVVTLADLFFGVARHSGDYDYDDCYEDCSL